MSVHQSTSGDTTDLIIRGIRNRESLDLQPNHAPVGTLDTRQGTISQFLAPLTQETFKQVVQEVEQKLRDCASNLVHVGLSRV